MLAETDEQEQVQEAIGSEQESEDQATARRKKQQRQRKTGKVARVQPSHLADGEEEEPG